MSGEDFRDYPRGPGPRQRREHEAMLERIRQRMADERGIPVNELDDALDRERDDR